MDFGVLRSKTFCSDEHAQKVALKSIKLTGMMMKIFSSREPAFLQQLLVSYNRPTIECAAPVWSPSSVAMCDTLERVQLRFTKRIKGCFKLTYDERLSALSLGTLICRRLYHDALLAYKSLHGYAAVTPGSLGLELSQAPIRRGGERYKHIKPDAGMIKSTYSCRLPVNWDKLPESALFSKSNADFKNKFRKHFKLTR